MPKIDENGQVHYKPNRYQLTDEGLCDNAYPKVMTSLQARQ